MASIGKIARRTFLFGAAAIAGGVALGVYAVRRDAPNPLLPRDGEVALNPFVVIDQDGVTLVAPRAEMGQGVRTTWAALIAEEMDIAWEDVRVIHGPPAKAYFNAAMIAEGLPNKGYDISNFQHNVGQALGQVGKLIDLQVTGGSTSMKDGYERMRATGAAAREMMKAVAADRLGVTIAELRTENGHVIGPDGTELAYADLAADAANVAPADVALRDPSEWRILGKSLLRVDMVEKATGTAEFGIDVRVPGLKYASIRINPRLGGTMRSIDFEDAAALPGVERIVDLGTGYAVIANNTWTAMQALDAVEVEWGDAPYPATTDAMLTRIEEAFETDPNSSMRDDGNADDIPSGAELVEAEYRVPFLAHATMEPMNATAHISPEGLEVWCGNQAPTFVRKACAEEAGLSEDQVTLHTTYLGGGFGRRGELDFARLATRVAMAMPGTPVQTTWSREEDMTHDFYRPAAIARMRGAVANGTAVHFDAQVAAPSVVRQAMNRMTGMPVGGPDKVHVEGLFNQPYGIENYRVRGYLADLDVPIGFWRAVGNSFNGFFHESFIDELAHKAGADPLAFRIALARNEFEPAAECLEAIRDMSGWTGDTPDGVGRGVAMTYSFGTPVAQAIEVVDEDGAIRMTQAWIACDPGVALDPSIIEAQMVGGMIFGLSSAIDEQITFADGMVEQLNFPDYDALRMHNTPKFDVRILQKNSHIGGIGEPGMPPAPAALANAIFDLTGERARELPLSKRFTFV